LNLIRTAIFFQSQASLLSHPFISHQLRASKPSKSKYSGIETIRQMNRLKTSTGHEIYSPATKTTKAAEASSPITNGTSTVVAHLVTKHVDDIAAL
jgi:hypothetical protein